MFNFIDDFDKMSNENVRNAVGAIVTQNNEILLVHKVKMMDVVEGGCNIVGTWDFPKGGVLVSDTSLEEALMRELQEETGSKQYKIEKRFKETIDFNFPKGYKYHTQKTVMYHVSYIGDRSDIKVQDDELDDIKFVKYEDVFSSLELEETRIFFNNVKDKVKR